MDLTDAPAVILSFFRESYSNEQLVDYADYKLGWPIQIGVRKELAIEGERFKNR
ncbi:hypothetical protein KHA80_08225 [Anaerobacillus sp. HL2]|nr:hypothetical protein KHA80_08225 [Anaerobacillus sp. HL2]